MSILDVLLNIDGKVWACVAVVGVVALKMSVDAWAIWLNWKYPPPL